MNSPLLTYAGKAAVKKRSMQVLIWVLRLVFLLGVGFVILNPLLTKLSMSFMDEVDLYDRTVKAIPRSTSRRRIILKPQILLVRKASS